MNEKVEKMKARTKEFALRIIRLYSALPRKTEAQVLGKQVLRSGTSVGAQYREAARARSDAELISKLECCLQELDETQYWLELIHETGLFDKTRLEPLMKETDELISIFTTTVKNVKFKKH